MWSLYETTKLNSETNLLLRLVDLILIYISQPYDRESISVDCWATQTVKTLNVGPDMKLLTYNAMPTVFVLGLCRLSNFSTLAHRWIDMVSRRPFEIEIKQQTSVIENNKRRMRSGDKW